MQCSGLRNGIADSDSRIRIHLHHVDIATQRLGLRTGDIAGFEHVLHNAELDAVAVPFDIGCLIGGLGASLHIRA